MITVYVNGNPVQLPEHSTVLTLLEQLDMTQGRLAVELNAAIVPRSQHISTPLNNGDILEIVHAIGGG